MKLTEGQVWVYCSKEGYQYNKYLVIDYVKDGRFHCRETPIGKVTSFVCHDDNYLLDNEYWKFMDAEKICELLRERSECIRIIHGNAEYERQLISAREFAEQEVKEKERICESMQARLIQTAEELDATIGSYRKQLVDANESINEMRDQLSNAIEENRRLQSIVDEHGKQTEKNKERITDTFPRITCDVEVYFKSETFVRVENVNAVRYENNKMMIADDNQNILAVFNENDVCSWTVYMKEKYKK